MVDILEGGTLLRLVKGSGIELKVDGSLYLLFMVSDFNVKISLTTKELIVEY
jgi:hypothetical protein